MRLFLLILFVALALVPSYPFDPRADGMFQKLTPDQRDEAIKYGKRNIRKDVTEFIKEWSVNNGDAGFAFITTEFLALAFAARQAALQSAELNNFDIEDTLAKSSGKLVFRVSLFGNTDSFSKDYTAVLKVGEKVHPSTFWNNSPGETYGGDPAKPQFVADSDFYFPSEGIDPNSTVTLVVQNKEAKEVSTFSFDLAKMR
jgi:hypothetical protein